MAVPGFQAFMLPVMQALTTGDVHRIGQIVDTAGDGLNVSAEDRGHLLPGGKTVLRSRVSWALTYLKQAGLVEAPSRGHYRITERGRQLLATTPTHIDNQLLDQFAEFRAFKERTRTEEEDAPAVQTVTVEAVTRAASPEEALESAYRTLRADLISQLLDVLKTVLPARFEVIVIDVLQAMGYGGGRAGAARAVGRSGDGGIDGVIEEDRLGLDTVYVQAKRWEGTVGRPVVQASAGALQGHSAHKGVMITTSDFTAEAKVYAKNLATRIVLVNGRRFAEMMIDHNVGVSDEVSYTIKRLDSDYFDE
jgi:restriction system protein